MREYSTRDVSDISGLPAAQVRRWARAGLVSPDKDESGHWRFSFQDLALLRMAGKLLDAGVSLNRVTRTLGELRAQLPERPLSSVRVVVLGEHVIVRDRMASWVLDTGQGVLDFDMTAVADGDQPQKQPPTQLPTESQPSVRSESAADLYQTALDLELAGRPDQARDAYAAALERDPGLVEAGINLGRLLHATKNFAQAESLYRAALEQDPDNVLAAFNLGVVLEDRDQSEAAIDAYRRAITIDDAYADAHFNLSRLLEARGEKQAALRHLSRFRRLTRA